MFDFPTHRLDCIDSNIQDHQQRRRRVVDFYCCCYFVVEWILNHLKLNLCLCVTPTQTRKMEGFAFLSIHIGYLLKKEEQSSSSQKYRMRMTAKPRKHQSVHTVVHGCVCFFCFLFFLERMGFSTTVSPGWWNLVVEVVDALRAFVEGHCAGEPRGRRAVSRTESRRGFIEQRCFEGRGTTGKVKVLQAGARRVDNKRKRAEARMNDVPAGKIRMKTINGAKCDWQHVWDLQGRNNMSERFVSKSIRFAFDCWSFHEYFIVLLPRVI